jgi:SDR family mycofactocin-dependent oxidoreductase
MGILDGKVAFITGVGRGQGRSHAVRLAEEGADIIGVDICRNVASIDYDLATVEDLDETARLVRALGRQMLTAVADVRRRDELEDAAAAGAAELGGIDIVCANAGICIMRRWDEVTDDIWGDQIDILLTGTWNTLAASLPHLLRRGGGSVIVTSSVAGVKGNPYFAGYVAAKHGVIGLAKSMANELALQNIRVNCISPNGVNTAMVAGLDNFASMLASDPHSKHIFTNALPLDLVEPRDISEAVHFLASPASRHMTGHNLCIDLGNTIR